MRMERVRNRREDSVPSTRGILANSALFRMADERQLDRLTAAAEPLRVPAHVCLVAQGQAPCGLFLIAYGQVKVGFEREDGHEKTLAILGQDKCFGLAEMLIDRPHQACVKSMADSMVLRLDAAEVLSVARENFGFAQALMMRVACQMYALTGDIESYSLQTARQRLARYLLRQSQYQAGQDLVLVASKTVVASRLSLTPETLSRLLHEFAAEGMISVAGRCIGILDPARVSELSAACGQEPHRSLAGRIHGGQ